MQHISIGELPQEKVRKLISRMASAAADDDAPVVGHAEVLAVIQAVGEGIFLDELAAIMRERDGMRRYIACSMLISIVPRSVIADESILVLEAGLRNPDVKACQLALGQLFMSGRATAEAIDDLVHVKRNVFRGKVAALWAASVLLDVIPTDRSEEDEDRLEPVVSECRQELFKALTTGDCSIVLAAARALGKDGVFRNEAFQAVRELYEVGDLETRTLVLGSVPTIGRWTPEIVKWLCDIARHESNDVAIRISAILALARSPADQKQVDRVLCGLMRSERCEVVQHACSALNARGNRIPHSTIEQVIESLQRQDKAHRVTAALCLAELGNRASAVLPEILDHLWQEDDKDVCHLLLDCVDKNSRLAVDLLVKVLADPSIKAIPVIQLTLLAVARRHLPEVCRMFSSGDALQRDMVAWVLQSLGPEAAPAIPLLMPFLAHSDVHVVKATLIAFSRVGTAARPAAKSVAQLLVSDADDIHSWAEEVLVGIGAEAYSALEQELKTAREPESVARVSSVMDRLRALPAIPEKSQVYGVDGVTAIDDLRIFAAMAEVLSQGATSFGDLAKLVQPILQRRGWLYLSSSPRFLSKVIERLEDRLSEHARKPVKLTSRGKKIKGGLTPRGKVFRQRVEQFIADNSLSKN